MEINAIKNLLIDSNNILVSTSSFLTLKKTLSENIGYKKTAGFLYRFGYEIGSSAAKTTALQKVHSLEAGANDSVHAMYGHVREVIIDHDFSKLLDGRADCIRGQWIDSFEAELHKQHFDISNECSCYTLCGYVSGFLSTQFRHPIMAIEMKCVAKGDPCCEFEVRLEENWNTETIKIYQSINLLNELETTYDALLHHKQLLDRVSTFHNNLTQSVTEKFTLHEIIQSAYDTLKIPIIIENLYGDEILQIGLSEQEQHLIKEKQHTLEYNKKYSNNSFYQSLTHSKLISPVLINKKHYANCSFVYVSPNKLEENDHLYLDRISNVVSLCLLYENSQIEEQERLTYTLMDRLLHNKFKTKADLESYLKFLPLKVTEPFSVAVIRISDKFNKNTLFDLHEQLLAFSKEFNLYLIPSLLSILEENLVILNTQYNDKNTFSQQLKAILQIMESRNPDYKYSVGISNPSDNLLAFEKAFEEATLSGKINNQNQINYYEDLGFLGHFIANMTDEQLHVIAKEMLNELYDFNDTRKKDLLYTLYQYLSNGQKLKETMEDLAISMGGLQYRIKQIEILLQKSLKDASFTSYLLIIIESLILLDELDFS